MNDAEVVEYWRFVLEEVVPATQKVSGIRSVKVYSGAGALRADILFLFEMDDASAYERLLVDPQVRRLLVQTYGAWDMKTASQGALSSTG